MTRRAMHFRMVPALLVLWLVVAALRGAAASGAGVLVATHDPAMIAAADRVVDITAT